MQISPDIIVFWRYGFLELNATIVFTWIVMVLVSAGSWLITRRLSSDVNISRRQNLLESIVSGMKGQLQDVMKQESRGIFSFLSTLFLFIATCNILSVVPGFIAPTGSLSTTAALSACVFIAVPVYGIAKIGVFQYLGNYLRPTFFMLPFNLIGELSRILALAVRLFGNIMSGAMIGAILLSIAPIFFPIIMQLLGLLTGLVQAYIFAILAAVYISAGMEIQQKK